MFFFLPHSLAQLRAKTLRPAPAFALLSMEPPQQFPVCLSLARLAEVAVKILAVPHRKRSLGLGAAATRFWVPRQTGRKRETHVNLNQFTIIGFIGRNAETKQLPNGTPVTKFSVATTKSWKDENGEWKNKTQWHSVVAFGQGFAQMASRLVKGTHIFVQGELTTREYARTISVPNGKKSIDHVIQQLVVELKAETIRVLDRAGSAQSGEVAEQPTDEDVPL